MQTESLPLLLLLVQAAATWYLAGLCWMVQRVHYPLFARVGEERFRAYEREHVARITPVVGPPMLVELAAAAALLWRAPAGIEPWIAWAGAGLLAAIWLSTALLQVPRHRDLEAGFEAGAHRRLVASNWIRTVAWSLRGALLLLALWQGAAGGAP